MPIRIRAMGLAWLLAANAPSAVAESVVPSKAPALPTHAAVPQRPQPSDLNQQSASAEIRHVARWVIDSGDNADMPYLLIDKVNARVFVFDAAGQLRGTAAALLGMTRGDRSAQGIGDQKIAAIRPEDRITPAGRFLSSLSRDVHGQEILLIDYAASIALHPVVKGTPAERRAQRLQSATAQDNRISYGCINVPPQFYEKVVSPAFTHSSGLVYILPETGSARDLFGSYKVEADAPRRVPALPH